MGAIRVSVLSWVTFPLAVMTKFVVALAMPGLSKVAKSAGGM